MSTMTLHDLRAIMRQCTGVEDATNLDGDIAAMPFREIGYDSLAVLEIASQIQRQYRIEIPDEAIEGMETPADVVDFVNTAVVAV